jgi:hypothetical protein
MIISNHITQELRLTFPLFASLVPNICIAASSIPKIKEYFKSLRFKILNVFLKRKNNKIKNSMDNRSLEITVLSPDILRR